LAGRPPLTPGHMEMLAGQRHRLTSDAEMRANDAAGRVRAGRGAGAVARGARLSGRAGAVRCEANLSGAIEGSQTERVNEESVSSVQSAVPFSGEGEAVRDAEGVWPRITPMGHE